MKRVYPPRGYPPDHRLVPQGFARQARHATVGPVDLGETQEFYDPIVDHPEFQKFERVAAYYVIQVNLGPEDGANAEGTVQLRPEPFVLRRITYACTGDAALSANTAILTDVVPGVGFPFLVGSQQARTVEVEWGDEFTRFLGRQRALVAALFADSFGFLDVPGVAIFQGSQNLNVRLVRLTWPFPTPFLGEEIPRFTTRWDFVFAGFSLLPKGVHQSGSVG